MSLRTIQNWLKWRNDWDSLCNRCGKCCYSRSRRPDGRVVIHYNRPCVYLDTETHLCTIYDDRFRVCKSCGKVNLFTALCHPTLPEDCAYARTFRRQKGQKEKCGGDIRH